MVARTRITKDDRPFWIRRSYLGASISNGNWIVAAALFLTGGVLLQRGWILLAVLLGVAGMLSIVWNQAVARTTTIIGGWIAMGASSGWVLGLAGDAMFGMPALGHALGLAIGIVGVIITID